MMQQSLLIQGCLRIDFEEKKLVMCNTFLDEALAFAVQFSKYLIQTTVSIHD